MASIRKHRDKWQVQVRHLGMRSLTKSFHKLKDAQEWARQTEVQADRRELPSDPRVLQQVTLSELVTRYRDTISIHKRSYEIERIVLNAFLLHPICRRRLSDLSATHFAAYREDRLKEIKIRLRPPPRFP